MADNVELVRRLWTAFERGGIEAVLEIADPDVEWEPYGGGGVVYRGHEGLRGYMQERADRHEQTDGRLYSAFAKGDFVVARGEIQIRAEHGITTMQPGWLYEFRNGRLLRFRGFPTQEAALRAAGLAPVDPQAIVRELWDTLNSRQLDRMYELFAEDVELRPYRAAKPVYRGVDGAREYFAEAFGESASVNITEYTLREIGDAIATSGSVHVVARSGAIAQRQAHYLFWVEEGKVVRAQSFARREDAIRAAEAAASATSG